MEAAGSLSEVQLDDSEVAELWATSGAQWLTDAGVQVPGQLVRTVLGLVESLDERDAGLGDLVPARGLGLLAERAATMGLPVSGRTSCGGASRLLRAADGWFVVSLARDDDRSLVPAWLGTELEVGDDPWPDIERVAAERSVDELSARGRLVGLPCGVVAETVGGDPVVTEQVGECAGRSMSGATVVNLAALWAGPLCADVLALTGARVITVESTRRPDGGRLARRFFQALHGRSESVALDLATRSGRSTLRDLLSAADVVIEGSRPRALEQMGIDVREVIATGPRVWLSITAHGRLGIEGERVGFGDDAAASGGLVGWVDGEPRFVADAVADPITGLFGAHATSHLLETGGRWLVDVALARVARFAAGGFIPRTAPSERPRARTDAGAPMPLGRDTLSVLRSLDIAPPDADDDVR